MVLLELRIPPVGVFLIIGVMMYILQISGYTLEIELLYRMIIIGPLALLGAYVALMGVIQFRRFKTTVNPFKPHESSSLVTTGVYSWSRNPMYLGLLCYLIALSVYFAAPITLIGPIFFKLYMDRFQIQPEERFLVELFGDEYLRYSKKVNRWIGSHD